jgi:NAD(P)-dependent dehydrogenase (short-subunit alcohol dehydrogenase family)
MASPKIILVTGANRGIGYAILQVLSTRFPQHTYLLGVRSLSNGEAAIESLRSQGLTSKFIAVELDITSDASINASVQTVTKDFGRLDVLIHNAAIACLEKPHDPGFREACNAVLNANVTSYMCLSAAFLPLLKTTSSSSPQVIALSSLRGSMAKLVQGGLPPTPSIPYNISKTALHVAMLEMAKTDEGKGVLWQSVSPGHCKTAFNGWIGKRDPVDGARIVGELVGDGGKSYNLEI